MRGSPPQMQTIGALHSWAASRHFSSGTMSLRLVEYSRMRPQQVQVRLQVCNGSSCRTIANFGVRRSLCLMMWAAIFAVNARGNRIESVCWRECLRWTGRGRPGRLGTRGNLRLRLPEETGEQEGGGRHAVRRVDATATRAQ